MRVLLDECLPRKFKLNFAEYDCLTVPEAGLSGITNGKLLTRAEELGFDVVLTIDQGFSYQQNLSGRNIAVVLLRANSNRLLDLEPLAEECRLRLTNLTRGDLVVVG